MSSTIDRRRFLRAATACAAASGLPRIALAAPQESRFEISLVESSFRNSLKENTFDNLDFAGIAKTRLDISAIEYVSSFFLSRAHDDEYLETLNKRAAEHEVRQLLVMVNDQGHIGDADLKRRRSALQNHRAWIDVAKALGCHSIQIDPTSGGTAAAQQKRAVDGTLALCEYAGKQGINVLLGDYGGASAAADWTASIVTAVNQPCCGALLRVGRARHSRDYKELVKLVPHAKGITVGTSGFDDTGQANNVNVPQALKRILAAGYRGYVGIDYAGNTLNELDGIRASKNLLDEIRSAR